MFVFSVRNDLSGQPTQLYHQTVCVNTGDPREVVVQFDPFTWKDVHQAARELRSIATALENIQECVVCRGHEVVFNKVGE